MSSDLKRKAKAGSFSRLVSNYRETTQSSDQKDSLTVSKALELSNQALSSLGRLKIRGEIHKYSLHRSSGHAYLSLKDSFSTIQAIIWRSVLNRINLDLSDGMEVEVSGRFEIYKPSGRLSLIIEKVELFGEGELRRKLEKLTASMLEKGYFDADKKKPIPEYVDSIAIVSSRDSAALEDVIRVARERFSGIKIFLSHTSVQGSGAENSIARAIRNADRNSDCDVILVVRGGGSFEDLFCFQELAVVKAIAECSKPVVSGIGHETDRVNADLAADYAAATPSQAAEVAVFNASSIQNELAMKKDRMSGLFLYRIEKHFTQLSYIELALSNFDRRIEGYQNRLRDSKIEIESLLRNLRDKKEKRLQYNFRKVLLLHPQKKLGLNLNKIRDFKLRMNVYLSSISKIEAALESKSLSLRQNFEKLVLRANERLVAKKNLVSSLSPSSIQKRGYALVLKDGEILKSSSTLKKGSEVNIRFYKGSAEASIIKIKK